MHLQSQNKRPIAVESSGSGRHELTNQSRLSFAGRGWGLKRQELEQTEREFSATTLGSVRKLKYFLSITACKPILAVSRGLSFS